VKEILISAGWVGELACHQKASKSIKGRLYIKSRAQNKTDALYLS